MDEGWIFAAVLTATSFAVATAALLVGHSVLRRLSAPAAPLWDGAETDDPVFLFDDDRLVDATDSARALLAAAPPMPGAVSDYARLTACLASRFPDLSRAMTTLAQAGRLRLAAAKGEALVLHAEWRNGLARLSLEATGDDAAPVPVDRLSLRCAEEELALLRALTDGAPVPVWRETESGDVVWANRAYLDLVLSGSPDGAGLTWPLPRLFAREAVLDAVTDAGGAAGSKRVQALVPAGTAPRWFDLNLSPQPDGVLAWGLPADAIMRAEQRLREFTQTLTKTFAQLPIGLAVFDGRRRLQLFNPALTDLTRLDPEFLIARPSLEVFLDRLREHQMIPEPQDYRGWRRALIDLESAAASGSYEDTWTLPSGQVFRVTGRPHPDGAVAFLFEDITAEVSLTRRFRAEIETGQDALDALEDAVAIFSNSGHMVLTNTAYCTLWGIDPMRTVAQTGLPEALRGWQARAGGGAHWARLRAAVGSGGRREGWAHPLVLDDGTPLRMRVVPMRRGTTMVSFQTIARAGGIGPEAASAAFQDGIGVPFDRPPATAARPESDPDRWTDGHADGHRPVPVRAGQPERAAPAHAPRMTGNAERDRAEVATAETVSPPILTHRSDWPAPAFGPGLAPTGAEGAAADEAIALPPFRSRLGPSRSGRTRH